MAVPTKCCYCNKQFTTLYAMVDGWACETDWEIHEDRTYVDRVREAESELRSYKRMKRDADERRSQQSGYIEAKFSTGEDQ